MAEIIYRKREASQVFDTLLFEREFPEHLLLVL
jgi:hypothetical protein